MKSYFYLQDVSELADSLFGFKPCLDENCDNPDSVVDPDESISSKTRGWDTFESQDPVSHNGYPEDNPRMHCISLRPSAVNTFAEIESLHTGISDIKYRFLEELIDHMYAFASMKLEHCEPDMKLVDLVILAANSLKTQYILQGASNCTYSSSYDEEEKTESGGYDPKPQCTDEYGYEVVCPGVTKEPEIHVPVDVTENPCPHGTTATEQYPCYEVTPKPTEKICSDGYTTEPPCKPHITEPHYEGFDVESKYGSVSPPFVGSLRGTPGVHYPNYTEIPITSFSCVGKKYIPGFYADLETRCQVRRFTFR